MATLLGPSELIVWVPLKATMTKECALEVRISGRHIHTGICTSSISGSLAVIWAASSMHPAAGFGPMLVAIPWIMNFDILGLAFISVACIWTLSSLFLISASKRRAAVDSVCVGVCSTIVFLEVTLANLKRNCPERASFMQRRIFSSMMPCGIVSVVVTTITRWMGVKTLLTKGTGFLFLSLVAVWKGVSAPWATAPASLVAPVVPVLGLRQ